MGKKLGGHRNESILIKVEAFDKSSAALPYKDEAR